MTEPTPQPADAASQIDFWFDFGSNYSHISVMRIEQEATKRNVKIVWTPFLLGPIFQSFGWNTSPFVLYKQQGAYMWKDMARQCAKYGVPWKQPTVFPRRAVLPLRVALIGADQAWIGEYCKKIMLLNFVADRDINASETVAEALADLGLPADEIIELAQSEQNKLRLRENTESAQALGIFGAPTFFVRGEMFWGNDRLDDALDFATRRINQWRDLGA
ncbi:MAG: 2-hydroxychromene-2-carboxylate isomerase [Candidatus Contendobacter sp.]|nr:2-hydroxychromene-2-carboxylate isomerase [Candidatus Contendobacter sp.]